MSSEVHRQPGAHQPAPPDQTGHPRLTSAYDLPQTPEEITRRKFMANATIAIGGIIGLGLVIPIVGSLIPETGSGGATWTPLNEKDWAAFQAATDKAVEIHFNLRAKDAYLPEQSTPASVWGVKVKDLAKFQAARTDLFGPNGKVLPNGFPSGATIVTIGFVMFSPICPHLGCRYSYDTDANKFACPCHGSQFSYDGTHIAGPAARGLDPLPLREQSGKAEVEWIRYKPTVPDRIVISYTD